VNTGQDAPGFVELARRPVAETGMAKHQRVGGRVLPMEDLGLPLRLALRGDLQGR